MKTSTLTFLLFALFHINFSYGSTCSEIAGRTAALNFYSTLSTNKIFGIPTTTELSKLEPHITKGLYKLLSATRKASDEFDRLPAEGTRLPIYEGSLFSSFADGYVSFHVSKAAPNSNDAEIYVLFQVPSYSFPYNVKQPGIETWKESIKVVKENGACIVDDIYFSSESTDKSLRNRLEEIINESRQALEGYRGKVPAAQ